MDFRFIAYFGYLHKYDGDNNGHTGDIHRILAGREPLTCV